MLNLGDVFPEELKNQSNINYTFLEKGTVLRMFVDHMNPPKIKMFIVLGSHEDQCALGTLLINSTVNQNMHFTLELQALQYKLDSREYSFLKHDSFVDCSEIQQFKNTEILQKVNEDNTKIVGLLSSDDFIGVKKTIISAETIRGRHKKQFGLYE